MIFGKYDDRMHATHERPVRKVEQAAVES